MSEWQPIESAPKDSNAITLLNEVPITISKALAIKTPPPKGNDHD